MQIKRTYLAMLAIVLLLGSISANSLAFALPEHVMKAVKPKPAPAVEKLAITTVKNGKEIKTFPEKIIIKNVGKLAVNNVRIVLSSEISKSFKLSDSAIKSLQPKANVTIAFELKGKPNVDAAGNLAGYKGKVIVAAEHVKPIFLPVNIGKQGSPYLSGYMDKVSMIADNRYNKISLINSLLSKQSKIQYNYEVTTSNGDKVITNTSDELVIKNLSDKELKNVRIYVSDVGHAFLLEQKNIQYLEPNGQVSIKLIPKIDAAGYSPKDIRGELLIIPSNDKPIQIPINIVGGVDKASIAEFEAKTTSGKNIITTAVDKITIKNIADRTMDSVQIIMSNSLGKVFSLSEESFQHIEPAEEINVELKYNLKDLRAFTQNYKGVLIVASEHHNTHSIPMSVEWNEISSEHFTIYARSGDEPTAKQIIDMLEANYQDVTSRFGEMKTKTVIYITNSMDEIKLINIAGHPYYSYTYDTAFICSCDDPDGNALKMFLYRLIINNYSSYYSMKKVTFDQENWLLDGITSYVAASIVDTGTSKKYIDAFTNNHADFKWYGYGSDPQYGATHTFLKFLSDKYGDAVIDKTIEYLSYGIVSTSRCSALEDCAVLHAVYDVSGLDIDKKRYTLVFKSLVEEWEEHVEDNYSDETMHIIVGSNFTTKNPFAYHVE